MSSESHEQQNKLLKTLEYSNIALRLADSYMKSTPGENGREMNIDQYLKLYKQKESDLKLENDSKDRVILVALKLSLDAIKENKECGLEAEGICLLIAYLALDKQILRDFFYGVDRSEPKKQEIWKAFKLLSTYQIVFFKSTDQIVRIDCFIQEVIRAHFKDLEVATLEKGLELIDNQSLVFEKVYHAMTLWDHASKHGVLVEKYHGLIGKIMNALNRNIRDSELLVRFGKKQFRPLKEHLGPHHEELLRLKNNLAIEMERTGAGGGRVEALKLLEESAAILDNIYPVVRSLAEFNIARHIDGKHANAPNVFEGILDDSKEVPVIPEKLILITKGHVALSHYKLAKCDPSRAKYAGELRKILGDLVDFSRSDSYSDSVLRLEPFKLEATRTLLMAV